MPTLTEALAFTRVLRERKLRTNPIVTIDGGIVRTNTSVKTK